MFALFFVSLRLMSVAKSRSRAYLFFLQNLLLSTFAILFLIRCYTIVCLLQVEDGDFTIVHFLQAFLEDCWLILLISLPLFFLGIVLSYISEKLAKWLSFVIITVILFIHIGFTEYFLTVHQLVDSSIYFFSIDELSKTVGLGERFSVLTVIALFALVILFVLVFRHMSKRENTMLTSQAYFFVFCGIMAWVFFPNYRSNKEESALSIGAESNVSLLFLNSSLIYLKQDEKQIQVLRNEFSDLDSSFTNGALAEGNYPLFRSFEQKSMLNELMNKTSDGKPPKIVFVIVEGLSSDLVGEKADLTGHLLPFVDSLAKKSIYFPNTLSTSQRTQNVLPSTLCSVPNVGEGTVFQQMSYPDHWSVLGLLNKKYTTRFYCGVPLEYMNMRGFMNQHSVSRLSDKWIRSVEVESKRLNSPWGVPDGALFRQNLSDSKKPNNKPAFDILLTISTHDPFVYPEKEHFTKLARAKFSLIKKTSKFFGSLNANAAQFGSYMYLDQQLKKYFAELKKRPDFQNTIFILTGDHGSEMWRRSALSKYHVPMIIYSPLLKKTYSTKEIVSHLDLTPTLHAYLQQAYGLVLPESTSYIGRQYLLPTENGNRSFVFTTDQLKIRDVLMRNIVLIENKLYRIDSGFNLTEIKNKKLRNKLLAQRELYKKMSRFTLHQNNLIPAKSYYQYYEKLVWERASERKYKINRYPNRKELVLVGNIEKALLDRQKIKINVSIKCSIPKGYSADSLPDLIMSSEPLVRMDRKKTVYRLVRPTGMNAVKTGNESVFQYEISFNSKQLAQLKKLKHCYVYLYYKMEKSPLIIEAETVISTIK